MRARGRTPPSPGRFLATDARAGDGRKNADATVAIDAVAEVGGVEIEWRSDPRHHEPDRGDAKGQLGVVGIRAHVSEEKKALGLLIPQGPEGSSPLLAERWATHAAGRAGPGMNRLTGSVRQCYRFTPFRGEGVWLSLNDVRR